MTTISAPIKSVLSFIAILLVMGPQAIAVEISLDEAVQIALNRSDRSRIIEGDLEVAEQTYGAARTNFILPAISINGSIPAYSLDESYRLYGNQRQKSVIKTTDIDFRSNIQLEQNLITGGKFTARAFLVKNENEYPRADSLEFRIDQSTRTGRYEFEFEQPLLKPSEAKFQLRNKKDDLEIARLGKVEEKAELKKEVVEAYFGVLQTELKLIRAIDQLRSARLQAAIDSIKREDGIFSDEQWLESSSARLDAELEEFDADNQHQEKTRELATLLDLSDDDAVEPTMPEPGEHLAEENRNRMIADWETCTTIRKAEFEFSKSKRAAKYATGSHGLSGNFRANYGFGRGTVVTNTAGVPDDNIKTSNWGVSLNFTFPIWDGGASGAAVKASQLGADKARLEFERIQKSARAKIVNLINRLDVSHRKLSLLDQKIDLAKNRLNIAEFRFGDGQISEIEMLKAKTFFLETRDKYFDELKSYLLDKIELDSRYSA